MPILVLPSLPANHYVRRRSYISNISKQSHQDCLFLIFRPDPVSCCGTLRTSSQYPHIGRTLIATWCCNYYSTIFTAHQEWLLNVSLTTVPDSLCQLVIVIAGTGGQLSAMATVGPRLHNAWAANWSGRCLCRPSSMHFIPPRHLELYPLGLVAIRTPAKSVQSHVIRPGEHYHSPRLCRIGTTLLQVRQGYARFGLPILKM
ncbi:hypothetical protein GGS21DRAFT_131295 [Xylaria nigripes]|nr:hypothetical protein GGS21DRAFT_131295 [Xylaria nigripes]